MIELKTEFVLDDSDLLDCLLENEISMLIMRKEWDKFGGINTSP